MERDCPCGAGLFADCCGRFLSGEAVAPTAEALMRARYSAFCEGAVDYLVETHHSTSHSANERAEAQRTVTETQWTNLLIIKTRKGGPDDSEGIVEFVAAYRRKPLSVLSGGPSQSAAEAGQLHERSRFVRDDSRWVYVDGDQLPPYEPKRSEACWCGSGKKFKHCHS